MSFQEYMVMKIEIVNVIIDDQIGIFSVIVEEMNKSKNSSLTIYGYTRDNQKLFLNKGVPPVGRNLLNGTITISDKIRATWLEAFPK